MAPEPLPHPDHLVLDLETGTVRVCGPATKEEKAAWQLWTRRRAMLEEERQEFLEMLNDPDCEDPGEVTAALVKTDEAIAFIDIALGGSRRALAILQRINVPESDEEEEMLDEGEHPAEG